MPLKTPAAFGLAKVHACLRYCAGYAGQAGGRSLVADNGVADLRLQQAFSLKRPTFKDLNAVAALSISALLWPAYLRPVSSGASVSDVYGASVRARRPAPPHGPSPGARTCSGVPAHASTSPRQRAGLADMLASVRH